MKKLTALCLLFFTFSCVSYDNAVIGLNFSQQGEYSRIGNGQRIAVFFSDTRKNKDIIGSKKLGDHLITINSNQNLIDVAKSKVAGDLMQHGFAIGCFRSSNKSLEIKVVEFAYEAKRGLVGKSNVNVALEIIAKDKKSGKKYRTKQNISLDKNHFIMPLIETDQETINLALQESFGSVAKDQKLLDFLSK
jgi:uncharacterized lipoprotein YajG